MEGRKIKNKIKLSQANNNNNGKRARVNKLSEKRLKFLTNIKHKFLTNSKYSKTHYKEKETVQQSYIQVDIIKKAKKKKSTPIGVISSRMQVKQNSEICILLVSRRRTKSEKSKPNNIISVSYTHLTLPTTPYV